VQVGLPTWTENDKQQLKSLIFLYSNTWPSYFKGGFSSVWISIEQSMMVSEMVDFFIGFVVRDWHVEAMGTMNYLRS